MTATLPLRIRGRVVPEALIEPLPEVLAPEGWRAHLGREGALMLRGALDADAVQAAREAVLDRLVAVGEVEPPAGVGLMTGTSRRRELQPDLGTFWQDVSERPALRAVSHAGALAAVMETLSGGPLQPDGFLWLRVKGQGAGSPLRSGLSLAGKAAEGGLLAWIPLGAIEFHQGPVYVVQDSHLNAVPAGAAPDLRPDASRLLTARFEPGDLLVLLPRTLYGAFDNDSRHRLVRASCESLWRKAGAPAVEAAYAEIPSAQPLDG
ncbi:MAG: hypothetical protein KDG89_04795 [Geminicoccaceae bacterium]|nr:hypothetical protein [Geminicoccaceae bacterium]